MNASAICVVPVLGSPPSFVAISPQGIVGRIEGRIQRYMSIKLGLSVANGVRTPTSLLVLTERKCATFWLGDITGRRSCALPQVLAWGMYRLLKLDLAIAFGVLHGARWPLKKPLLKRSPVTTSRAVLWPVDLTHRCARACVTPGVLNFIPSVGPLVATVIPLPVVLVSPGRDSVDLLLAIGLPVMTHFVVGHIIEPKLMGDSLELHPITVRGARVADDWPMIEECASGQVAFRFPPCSCVRRCCSLSSSGAASGEFRACSSPRPSPPRRSSFSRRATPMLSFISHTPISFLLFAPPFWRLPETKRLRVFRRRSRLAAFRASLRHPPSERVESFHTPPYIPQSIEVTMPFAMLLSGDLGGDAHHTDKDLEGGARKFYERAFVPPPLSGFVCYLCCVFASLSDKDIGEVNLCFGVL